MPKDAKLGLIVGMGVMVLILIFFFRRDVESTETRPVANAVSASSKSPHIPSASVVSNIVPGNSQPVHRVRPIMTAARN